MRRFTAIEKGILALAALLVICGGWAALVPFEKMDVHPAYHTGKVRFGEWVQHISKSDARLMAFLPASSVPDFAGWFYIAQELRTKPT